VLKEADRATVADVPLTVGKVDPPVETLDIKLTGDKEKGDFTMSWGSLSLKTSFTAR
jgi:hypothetical protein